MPLWMPALTHPDGVEKLPKIVNMSKRRNLNPCTLIEYLAGFLCLDMLGASPLHIYFLYYRISENFRNILFSEGRSIPKICIIEHYASLINFRREENIRNIYLLQIRLAF